MASQYQKKQDGRKPFKGKKGGKGVKPAVRVEQGAPKYVYTSKCCEVVATKPECVRDGTTQLKERKATLGSWTCSKCRRKAKVSRSLNAENLKVSDLLTARTGPNHAVRGL